MRIEIEPGVRLCDRPHDAERVAQPHDVVGPLVQRPLAGWPAVAAAVAAHVEVDEDQRDIAAALPPQWVRFESFSGAGHGIWRDRPEAAMALLREFIATGEKG